MPRQRTGVKGSFQMLPLRYKFILTGLFLSSLGLFFTWYKDVDSFNTGVTYSALAGPGSMIGLSALTFNFVTACLVLYFIKFEKDPFISMSRPSFEKWHGPVYLYSALLLASIYFHSDFGINVDQKTVGLGVYIGVFGAVISTFGALLFKVKKLAPILETALEETEEVAVEMPKIETMIPNDVHFVEDVLEEDNPVARDLWQKQKQIESKLMNRINRDLVDEIDSQRGSDVSAPGGAGAVSGVSGKGVEGYGSYQIRTDL